MSAPQVTPEVLWAQRSSKDDAERNYIYLTIGVPDVPKAQMQLDLKPTTLTFTGTSDTKKTTYHVELEFYADIDPENSKINHTPANVQLVLRKKDLKAEYWPRLLKTDKKMHFLRTDFDKWADEDEQDDAEDDEYMNQFGDMGGMGGMGGDGGFGGIDFSKLGGGMPGMEGVGAGGEEDEDEDDEDMPDLEDDKDASKEVVTDAEKGKAS